MSPTQKIKLRKAGLVAYVPTWLPKGYKLKSFEISDEKDVAMKSYSLNYTNAKGGGFTIQSASDGLGDAFFDNAEDDGKPTGVLKVKNPQLGMIHVELYFKGKLREFHNQWIELKSKAYPRYLMLIGSGVGKEDLKKLYASLRLVN